MEVVFLTEGGYQGKVSRTNPNSKLPLPWISKLNADHYPIPLVEQLKDNSYDIGIVILPKNKKPFLNIDVVNHMKRVCKLTTVMQESNYHLWQDDDIEDQVWYLNNLSEVDFMFVHNNIDKQYYNGLLNKPCEKLPSLMFTEHIKNSSEKKDQVILGGNLVGIYRGIDSFMIARELELPIYALSSGRKKQREEELGINHLPWMDWSSWMYELSKFKYAVQVGTGAAGSFNLSCAYLGIPCIGLKALETQNLCFPDLSIDEVDLKKGKELIIKLKTNPSFYKEQSQKAQENYKKHFDESVFFRTFTEIFNKHYSLKYS
jgi:hypothetical protein